MIRATKLAMQKMNPRLGDRFWQTLKHDFACFFIFNFYKKLFWLINDNLSRFLLFSTTFRRHVAKIWIKWDEMKQDKAIPLLDGSFWELQSCVRWKNIPWYMEWTEMNVFIKVLKMTYNRSEGVCWMLILGPLQSSFRITAVWLEPMWLVPPISPPTTTPGWLIS